MPVTLFALACSDGIFSYLRQQNVTKSYQLAVMFEDILLTSTLGSRLDIALSFIQGQFSIDLPKKKGAIDHSQVFLKSLFIKKKKKKRFAQIMPNFGFQNGAPILSFPRYDKTFALFLHQHNSFRSCNTTEKKGRSEI